MTGLFWNGRTRSVTKAEAERFTSPGETGRRLVIALRAWLSHALDELPTEARAWYRVELDPPEWLDPGHPHLALNECRRLVNGIPDTDPGWMYWNIEQARAVAVLHAARAAVVATAKVPAPHALVLLERALALGIELARAHVEPWEPCAATGQKVKNAARDGHASTHGTPEEKAKRWAEYRSAVVAILERAPHLSLTDARKRAARELEVSLTTIKRHTANLKK